MKNKPYSEYEITIAEFNDAVDELHRLRDLFDYVTSDYFEIFNKELTLAQDRVDLLTMKLKKYAEDEKVAVNVNVLIETQSDWGRF